MCQKMFNRIGCESLRLYDPPAARFVSTLRRCWMGARESDVIEARWVDDLSSYVKPYWDHLLSGPWAQGVTNGTLSLPEMQGWMIQLYPFIHTFPKFLAEALIKCEDDYSRGFYIMNIRVEKSHA